MNNHAEVRKIAPRPNVASTVCPINPVLTPAAVVMPALGPCAMDLDITKSMPCPGVEISSNEATTNKAQETSNIRAPRSAISTEETANRCQLSDQSLA
jgi:hypothetical protein